MSINRILGKRVALSLLEKETKSKSGIIIATDNVKETNVGIIEYVGDVDNLKKGDKVFFQEYSGNEVKINGKSLKVINLEDILAVYED